MILKIKKILILMADKKFNMKTKRTLQGIITHQTSPLKTTMIFLWEKKNAIKLIGPLWGLSLNLLTLFVQQLVKAIALSYLQNPSHTYSILMLNWEHSI